MVNAIVGGVPGAMFGSVVMMLVNRYGDEWIRWRL